MRSGGIACSLNRARYFKGLERIAGAKVEPLSLDAL
jgi:hypothetical protein